MCVHPSSKSNSAQNKIADEINEQYNDMDSLSEFAGYCKYLDSGNDLTTNQSDLKVLHLNVRSILSKQSDFGKLLSHNKIDVCTINETWLKKDNKHLLKLCDYTCVTQGHKIGKGGEVGIAISKDLKFRKREDLENCLEMLEVCIIELLGRKRKVLIASVYRAPNSNDKEFLNNLRKLIDLCKKEQNCEIIIGLDHNYDLLKSHTHHATQDLIDLLLNSDLWPVITKPTRITKNSATLIDNILVSPNIYGSYQCGIMLEDLSDHLPCLLVAKDLKLERKEPVVITSRKITPSTVSKIKAKLSSLDLMPHLLDKGVNDGFEYLHEKVIGIVDKIAPYESFIPSKHKFRRDPWLPFSLLKSIRKQQQLYRQTLKRGCSQEHIDHYKSYRNTLTKLKRNCRNQYYLNKCCEFKSNTKALWNIINKVARDNKDKSCVIGYIKDGDISYNKPK